MGYVNKINIGGGTHLIEPTLFAVVGGTSSAYTASIDNFELVQGTIVTIKIPTGKANAANVTLNVNSTGAKSIYYEGAAVATNSLIEGRIYSLVAINNSNTWTWELLNDLPTDDRIEIMNMIESE